MGIYNANNLRVYVGGTLVANNTTCSVEITSEEVQQNTKDAGGWVAARTTRKRVTVTAEHLFDEADNGIDTVITSQLADTPVTILIGEDTPTLGEISLSGQFLIGNTSIGGGVDEDATAGFTFNSTGAVTYTVGSV